VSAPPSGAGGQAPTLVLVHGIGADGRMFAPVAQRLANSARIIVWDLPGYGGKRLDGPLTFAGLAAALAADLDAMGVEHAVVLGHSIGGMVAQELAATSPQRVRALILSATTAVFGSRDGSFQQQFVQDRLGPLDAGRTMAEMAADFAPGLVGSAAAPDAAPALVRLMAEVPAETFRAAVACLVTFNRRAELERIAVPTLLIAGDEDTNAPLKTMTRMAEVIPGARLEVLRGTGHLAPLECPDCYADAVRRFLAELPESPE
jgi:pimeloyl-ACP methyl ester carboxylesterase